MEALEDGWRKERKARLAQELKDSDTIEQMERFFECVREVGALAVVFAGQIPAVQHATVLAIFGEDILPEEEAPKGLALGATCSGKEELSYCPADRDARYGEVCCCAAQKVVSCKRTDVSGQRAPSS